MAELGLGMMRLPVLDENDFSSVDYDQVSKMVDALMDAGFNCFDTAYPYHEGLSEVALRKCLVERYPRDSFKVFDKLPTFAITEESQLEPIFKEQLERCGVEYFDYYLMHNVSGYSEKGWLDVESAQAAAEIILLLGGVIIIVLVALYLYRNYLTNLSEDISNNEVNNFNNEILHMEEYFK